MLPTATTTSHSHTPHFRGGAACLPSSCSRREGSVHLKNRVQSNWGKDWVVKASAVPMFPLRWPINCSKTKVLPKQDSNSNNSLPSTFNEVNF